jgi:hypothetical protein
MVSIMTKPQDSHKQETQLPLSHEQVGVLVDENTRIKKENLSLKKPSGLVCKSNVLGRSLKSVLLITLIKVTY